MDKEYLHHLGISALRGLAWFVYALFGGTRGYGTDNIPREGTVLLACNHTSLSDPVGLLITSPRHLHYMAAKELFDIPILGKVIAFLQAFPVRRGENDVKALGVCRQLLKEGNAVVVYPEGKITTDGYLGPFYDGVVLMALRAKCPVIPVVVKGFDKMLPLGSKYPRFAHKEVRYGKSISFDFGGSGLSLKEQVVQASSQLRQAMIAMGAKERPEAEKPQ